MEDKKLLKKLSILALVITGLLLTGCINVQSNIALYGDEQWSGVQAFQLSAEFVEMMEESDSGGDISGTMDAENIDELLEQAQQAAGRGDVSASFNEYRGDDGSLNYAMQANGQNYDLLNEVFFQGEADISVAVVDGQRQVTIHHVFTDPSADPNAQQQEMTPAEQEMQMQMLQAFGLNISFRISGDKIISSNATRVEGNTAIWEAPGEIQVTLTEAAALDPADLELAPPSSDSLFSPQVFEQMMEEMAQDMPQGMDPADTISALEENQSADESGTATTGDTTAQSDAATDTSAAEMSSEDSEASPDETSAETPATTTENADDTDATMQGEAETAPAQSEPETEAAASPTEEDTGLPQSGAVLPTSASRVKLAFGGLVLAILGGAAWVNVWRKAR